MWVVYEGSMWLGPISWVHNVENATKYNLRAARQWARQYKVGYMLLEDARLIQTLRDL